MSYRVWEACAEQLRGELAVDDRHMHPRILVAKCGLGLVEGIRKTACWTGGVIVVDGTARPSRQAGRMVHELGHFTLDRYNEEQSERGASAVGAAILVPRRALDSALKRRGGDFEAVRADFEHASAELLARRIVDVREAVVTIADGRRIRARVSSPWLPEPRAGLAKDEARVLRAVLEERRQIDEGWIRGVPVFEPGYDRVILIAEAEQLALRF